MSERQKILVLSYLFPNSQQPNHGIFVLNRLKALSQYVDIKVINPIPWFPGQFLFSRYKENKLIPKKEIIGGLEVYHPRFLSIPKFFKSNEANSYLKAIDSLINNIRTDFKFEIVDMHWTFPDLPAGLKIAKKYKSKSMVTLRGMEAFHLQDKDNRKEIVADGLKAVDAIISLSNEMKDIADKITDQPDKSTVIRNGVDTEQFYYIPQQQARSKIKMDINEISILSVGSLIYRKGFDLLVNCISELVKIDKYKNIRLYIIGSQGPEGDYRKELYALIKEKNVEKNIIFKGQVKNKDLKYWYSAVDLFCLASRGEGSPNVLSEAIGCGCPSVTTNVGSAKEIIESEQNLGEWVNVDSVNSLLNGINTVLENDFNREKNAKRFNKFNWQWCAEKVIPIFQSVKNQ